MVESVLGDVEIKHHFVIALFVIWENIVTLSFVSTVVAIFVYFIIVPFFTVFFQTINS